MRRILFLTLLGFTNLENRGIYPDLLREFVRRGDIVYVVSPIERKNNKKTHIVKEDSWEILKVRTGNIQQTNLIEKGIATVLLEQQFINAIKKYYSNTKFDLVLYSTPPVTLARVVAYIKKRDKALSYLMLKDIFPQNSIDLGILKKTGLKGVIYKYFSLKEQKLYKLSDVIGCTSEANIRYVKEHDELDKKKIIEFCPNCSDWYDL